MKKILIAGVGNIARRDDGIGAHIVDYILNSGMEVPDNIEVVDVGMALYDLLHVMNGKEKVIIVDALRYEGEPGGIFRFPADMIIRKSWDSISRFSGIKETVQHLYIHSGETDVEMIGIIPEDTESYGFGLSSTLEKIVGKAAGVCLKAAADE